MKNNEDIKVSVIIPLYNAQEYMGSGILSVMEQSHKNLEIILVNDGSTDDTEEVCRQYEKSDPRICVVTQENRGPGNARNHGLDVATGDFVCFIDSDDRLEVTAIEKMLCSMDADCDLIQCRSKKIYVDNQEDLEVWNEETIVLEPVKALEDYLCSVKPIVRFSVWAKLIRKSAIGNLRFPEMNNSEDVAFNAYLIHQCRKIVYIPDTLYFVTVREGSLSRGTLNRKKIDAGLKCNELILKLILENEKYSSLKKRVYWSSASTMMMNACTVYKDKTENWKKDLKYLQKKSKELEIPKRLMNIKQRSVIVFFRRFPKIFAALGSRILR